MAPVEILILKRGKGLRNHHLPNRHSLHHVVPVGSRVWRGHRVVLPLPLHPVRLHVLLRDVHVVTHVVTPLALIPAILAALAPIPRLLPFQRIHQLGGIQLDILGDVPAPHVLLHLERVLLLRRALGGVARGSLLLLLFLSLHLRLPRGEVILHQRSRRRRRVQPLLTGAVAVLLERPAARVAPLASSPERAPAFGMVLFVHILLVSGLSGRFLVTFHDSAGSVVLYVSLRLAE
mmetsp:Transcript_2511/g.11370  ORF Transcript_2511/g.11370 Transcript_2511/m.11370 type:complete len:234 (-) Transcript_2511:1143-1844(-)